MMNYDTITIKGYRRTGGGVLDDVEIDLEDYPLPKPDLPEEAADLLYDSRRDYFDQLVAYKNHRFGTNGA